LGSHKKVARKEHRMKTYLFSGLLIAGLLLSSGIPLQAAEEAKAEAIPTTHEDMVKALIGSVETLTVLLESIKDEAGIPAAKEKLTAILRHQNTLSVAMQKMGDPKPEDEAKLKEKYEEKMNAATEKLAAQYQRLAAIEAFKKTMQEIKALVDKEQAK
jgi:glycyl-tRNA synthetase beta subunit